MAIAEFIFDMPPTLNVQIREARTHWSKSAKTKELWTNRICKWAKGGAVFKGEVWIDFEWRVFSRANDADNVSAAAKFVMDGLVAAGVIKGDSLMTIQSPVVHAYGKSPRGEESVRVRISDRPLWRMEETNAADLQCGNPD
jgi:hypothetical protein